MNTTNSSYCREMTNDRRSMESQKKYIVYFNHNFVSRKLWEMWTNKKEENEHYLMK